MKLKILIALIITISALSGCESAQKRELNVNDDIITISGKTYSEVGVYGEVISKPEIVVGDNMFSTQINDWYMNWNQYEGKTIEIEGFKLEAQGYTFVTRYSDVSCSNCPQGYAYFEYDFDDVELEIPDTTQWMKITGTMTKGYDNPDDESTGYYYIKASSVELTSKMGKERVNN